MNQEVLDWDQKLKLAVTLFEYNPSAYKDTLTDDQMIGILNIYIRDYSGTQGMQKFQQMIRRMNGNKEQAN